VEASRLRAVIARSAVVVTSGARQHISESDTILIMRQTLLPIQEVARKLEIPAQYFEQLGPFTAKLKLELLADPGFQSRGKLILVTATSPTTSGEGKTVTAISLTQGLALLGKKVVITSREPSLGPVFGMKGGAAGGGLSRIEPSEKINLHFNGDFHAISSAHNLLAALIDAHLFHGNDLDLDPARVAWPRTMDMNDRALRRIAVSLDSKKDGSRPQRFAAALGRDRDWRNPRRKTSDGERFGRHRRNDGAADRRHPAQSGTDHRRHARTGACRTLRQHRARNQQRDFAADGFTAGRLRGE
jgi:hypothetical protein